MFSYNYISTCNQYKLDCGYQLISTTQPFLLVFHNITLGWHTQHTQCQNRICQFEKTKKNVCSINSVFMRNFFLSFICLVIFWLLKQFARRSKTYEFVRFLHNLALTILILHKLCCFRMNILYVCCMHCSDRAHHALYIYITWNISIARLRANRKFSTNMSSYIISTYIIMSCIAFMHYKKALHENKKQKQI